jgi:hypothetical protein
VVRDVRGLDRRSASTNPPLDSNKRKEVNEVNEERGREEKSRGISDVERHEELSRTERSRIKGTERSVSERESTSF